MWWFMLPFRALRFVLRGLREMFWELTAPE